VLENAKNARAGSQASPAVANRPALAKDRRVSLAQQLLITAIAKHLYGFLPASGNNRTSFPLAAAQAGVAEAWPPGAVSKGPGIERMIGWMLANRRERLPALIETIVALSVSYRRRAAEPLSREEVVELDRLVLQLGVHVPAIQAADLLSALPSRASPPAAEAAAAPAVGVTALRELEQRHRDLAALPPQPRGFAFERFLTDLFAAFGLAPRGSFRLTGEQIDGSFVLNHETYLLEAKWVSSPVGVEALHTFTGKVQTEASWSRGLIISNSGFSPDGLIAYGTRNPVICMDGYDLNEMLRRQLALPDVLSATVRRAAENGRPLTHVRDLFP
jgi:hypothetical protein